MPQSSSHKLVQYKVVRETKHNSVTLQIVVLILNQDLGLQAF